MEEELRRGTEKNQENGGIKDNVTNSNIKKYLRELNSGAGAKDDDTDNMEEDPLPRKKKSRESKKRRKDRKKKEN